MDIEKFVKVSSLNVDIDSVPQALALALTEGNCIQVARKRRGLYVLRAHASKLEYYDRVAHTKECAICHELRYLPHIDICVRCGGDICF